MYYYVSKEFLRLHFAVDHVLSIPEYDSENGNKNIELKIWH